MLFNRVLSQVDAQARAQQAQRIEAETRADRAQAAAASKALEEGRKISPEKLAEIRENFDEFDSTGDGQLSETEFYSGLTSVGIAMTKEKVKENFDKLKDADSGAITFDAFLPFMEEHLTVRGASQSDVLSAFADLLPKTDDDAKAAVISMGMLARCIHDHDLLEYLTTNMPKAEPPNLTRACPFLSTSRRGLKP